jgi:hypothetical protein
VSAHLVIEIIRVSKEGCVELVHCFDDLFGEWFAIFAHYVALEEGMRCNKGK